MEPHIVIRSKQEVAELREAVELRLKKRTTKLDRYYLQGILNLLLWLESADAPPPITIRTENQ